MSQHFKPRRLSHLSDNELMRLSYNQMADKYGITVTTVHKERHRRGLTFPELLYRCKLADVSDAELMVDLPAKEIADKYKVCVATLVNERRRRNLIKNKARSQAAKAIKRKRKLLEMTDSELDNLSTREVMVKYDVCKDAVTKERRRRGLTRPTGKSGQTALKNVSDAELTDLRLQDIAAKYDISFGTVWAERKRRKLPSSKPSHRVRKLNRASDEELTDMSQLTLATKYDVCLHTVWAERKHRGIVIKELRKTSKSYKRKLDHVSNKELTETSHSVLATKYGVHLDTVRKEYERRGFVIEKKARKPRKNKRKLMHVSNKKLFNTEIKKLARRYNVNALTVENERKRREEENSITKPHRPYRRKLDHISDEEMVDSRNCDLAQKYNVHRSTITAERSRRGIQRIFAYKAKAATDEELTTLTNHQLIEKYGASAPSILAERRRRKLPDKKKRPAKIEKTLSVASLDLSLPRRARKPGGCVDWSIVPDDQFIGRTDYELAVFLWCPPWRVRGERERRGLPKVTAPRRKNEGTPPTDEELATLTTTELTAKYGRSSSWVASYRRKRGIQPSLERGMWKPNALSCVSNVEFERYSNQRLATKHGSSVETARHERERRGLPPWHQIKKRRGICVTITDEQLASWPSQITGRVYGVTTAAVCTERRSRNIPKPFRPEQLKDDVLLKFSVGHLSRATNAARWWVKLVQQHRKAELAEIKNTKKDCVILSLKRVAAETTNDIKRTRSLVGARREWRSPLVGAAVTVPTPVGVRPPKRRKRSLFNTLLRVMMPLDED